MTAMPAYVRDCRAALDAAQRRHHDAQEALGVAQNAYAAAMAKYIVQLQSAAERGAQGRLTVTSDVDLADLLNSDPFVIGNAWQSYPEWTGDGYGIALAFSEPVADPTHLLAYFCRANLAMGHDGFDGEYTGSPVDTPDENGRALVWYWSCDLTKSARDDVAAELSELPTFMREGSPVRKTDRSGHGTKGTRAVVGVGARLQVFMALDN